MKFFIPTTNLSQIKRRRNWGDWSGSTERICLSHKKMTIEEATKSQAPNL